MPPDDGGADVRDVEVSFRLARDTVDVVEGGAATVTIVVETDGPPTDRSFVATLTPVGLSASEGLDFPAEPLEVPLAAGLADGSEVAVELATFDDYKVEETEAFGVELSVDDFRFATALVSIADNDRPRFFGVGAVLDEIDLATGARTSRGAFDFVGPRSLDTLVYDRERDRLLLRDGAALWEFDLESRQWRCLYQSFPGNRGLLLDGDELLTIGSIEQRLYRFDLATGDFTSVGPMGIGLHSLGFSRDRQTLYAFRSNQVFVVDPATGAATLTGAIANRETGLAVRPTYACDISPDDGLAYCTTWDEEVIAFDPARRSATILGRHVMRAGPTAVAVGPGSKIFVAEGNTVQAMTATAGVPVVDRYTVGLRRFMRIANTSDPDRFWVLAGSFGYGSHLFSVDVETFSIVPGPYIAPYLTSIARDPTTDTLYGLSSSGPALVEIDPATGDLTGIEIAGSRPDVLAIAPDDGSMWVIDSDLGRVVDGRFVYIPDTNGYYKDLAFDATGRLYGSATNRLDMISRDTGQPLATHEAPTMGKLAPRGGALLGVGAAFFDIDPESATFTTIDRLPFRSKGLAIDEEGGRAYTYASPFLYTVDLETGRATSRFRFASINALAFDPGARVLWAASDQLYAIDPEAGSATALSLERSLNMSGLAVDPTGQLIVSLGVGELLSIDPATGAITTNPLILPTGSRLGFAPDGRLLGYKSSSLFSIDLTAQTLTTLPIELHPNLAGFDSQD